MRGSLVVAPLLVSTLSASSARADTPSDVLAALARASDTQGGAAGWPPGSATGPLTLALLAPAPFTPGLATPACREEVSSAARAPTTWLGTPRAFQARLVPSLSLAAFTRATCGGDRAIGGAVTVAIPLQTNLSLLLGAGLIHVAPPTAPGGFASRTSTAGEGRVDLVLRRPGGHWRAIGIGSRLFSVAGTW